MDLLEGAALYLTIREAGSLRRAAMKLGVSAAAVSRRLDALEGLLDARLLVRTTRRLVPTEAGDRFQTEAVKLLAAARRARHAVRPEAGVSGTLVVSASVTYGLLEVGPAVDELLRRHPALEVELRLEDRLTDLLDEGVDVAIRAAVGIGDSPSLVAKRLRRVERRFVASPPYLRRRGTPRRVEQLIDHDLLGGAGMGDATELTVTQGGAPVTIPLAPRLRTRNLLAIRDAALRGTGVALLPDFVVDPFCEDERLRAILTGAELGAATVHAVYRVERRGDPAVRALVEVLAR